MTRKKITNPIMLMIVFIVLNFVISLSGTLFSGILDRIAVSMQIDVSETGYLTSLYAYGAVGAPIILVLLRKTPSSLLLKIMLLLNILFGFLSITAVHFGLLLFARFMLGLTGTTYNVLATTTVAALSSKAKVGRNLSLLIAGAATSLMIGVPLCRILISSFSWQSIYFVLILLMIVGLAYFVFFLPESGHSEASIRFRKEIAMLKEKKVYMTVLFSLISFIGYGAFYTYLTPYLVEMFPVIEPYMSLILVLVGSAAFAGNLFGGIVCDKIGFERALFFGSLIQAGFGGLIWLCSGMMLASTALVLLWMFDGWFIGLQLNTGINIVTDRKSNLLVSANGSVIQFAQAIGATICSLIIANAGISLSILPSIVCSLIVVVLLLPCLGRK